VGKTTRPEREKVVAVVRFSVHVGTEKRRDWYLIGSEPTIETVTAWQLLEALRDEFGEE
jgi:hypothetical protein